MIDSLALSSAVKAKKDALLALKDAEKHTLDPTGLVYAKAAMAATRKAARHQAAYFLEKWSRHNMDEYIHNRRRPEAISDTDVALLLEARDSSVDALQAVMTDLIMKAWRQTYGNTLSIPWRLIAIEGYDSQENMVIRFAHD